MQTFFETIGTGFLIAGMTIAGWFGVAPQAPEIVVGASVQTPQVRALFETTLASRITSSATSMTLTSATDKDGNTLASSTYAFIIDEGTSVEEFVIADCTGTTCTNMSRGISVSTGTTTVASLQFEHRRGASVKITDAPALVFIANVFRGTQNIENILRYNSNLTFTDDKQIISKKYVDDTAFSGAGVIDATTAAKGVVELATQAETASSTGTGGSGPLVITNSTATSTYNSATAALRVVVTQNDGKIDSGFISTSTLQAPPTGTIIPHASTSTLPSGYLRADGSTVSRTTYSNLFSVIGGNYGIGDGSTTFHLPRSVSSYKGVQVDNTSSNTQMVGTTATWSHTVSASSTLLVMGVVHNNSGTGVPTATYSGVSMTQIDNMAIGSSGNASWFYLANPPVGTANIVISSLPNTNSAAVAVNYMDLPGVTLERHNASSTAAYNQPFVTYSTTTPPALFVAFYTIDQGSTTPSILSGTQRISARGSMGSTGVSAVIVDSASGDQISALYTVQTGGAREMKAFSATFKPFVNPYFGSDIIKY